MDTDINTIIKGKGPEAVQSLQNFVDAATQVFAFPELNINSKRKQLWEALFTLAKSTKDQTVLMNCFIAVRILRYQILIM
jgi:hypothetical protein